MESILGASRVSPASHLQFSFNLIACNVARSVGGSASRADTHGGCPFGGPPIASTFQSPPSINLNSFIVCLLSLGRRLETRLSCRAGGGGGGRSSGRSSGRGSGRGGRPKWPARQPIEFNPIE